MQASPSKLPLPRFVFWGYSALSMSLRRDPAVHGRAEVRLSVGSPRRGSVEGGPCPGGGHALHAPDALCWLATNWRRMATAFEPRDDAAEGPKDGVFDLAAGLGLAAEGPITWTVCGGEVEVRSGRHPHAFGHETILAVEILSGFAMRHGGGAARAAVQGHGGGRGRLGDGLRGNRRAALGRRGPRRGGGADRSGMARGGDAQGGLLLPPSRGGIDRYVRASVWPLAEQGRFALGRRPEGEPDWHGLGWDAPGFAALPTLAALEASTPQEVRDLYAFGAKDGEPLSWDGFVAAALMQRTGDLRAALYWPRPAGAA